MKLIQNLPQTKNFPIPILLHFDGVINLYFNLKYLIFVEI